MMKTVRVESTVILTGEDGKAVSVNKERILSELDSTDPKHIQRYCQLEPNSQDPRWIDFGHQKPLLIC
jgi:hypothetical protein